VVRSLTSASLETVPEPFPASGTETSSARPPATGATVTGPRTGPEAAARPCSAASWRPTAGPVRSGPVTTTSAGEGPCGNARWMLFMVWTAGRPRGASIAG
jgi:hypothetical protein